MNGTLLKELRRSARVTQAELAAALDLHQCDVSSLENGRKDLTPELYHRASLAILEMKAEKDKRFETLAAGGTPA